MNYDMMKVAIQSMEDKMRKAAVGTSYKYNTPMVIVSVTGCDVGVTVWLGKLERKANGLQSFDEAVVEAQAMTNWVVAQLDGTALARTLGLEVAHA